LFGFRTLFILSVIPGVCGFDHLLETEVIENTVIIN